MSNLLLDSQPLLVLPELAQLIGLNESIILQQIHYWLKLNEKTGTNLRDGRYWTFRSMEEWQKEDFPFWGLNTVKRTFTSLKSLGLILTGNYNKASFDQTIWYSIDYAALDNLVNQAISPLAQNGPMHRPKMGQTIQENNIKESTPREMRKDKDDSKSTEKLGTNFPLPSKIRSILNSQENPYDYKQIESRLEEARQYVATMPDSKKPGCSLTEKQLQQKALSDSALTVPPVYSSKANTLRLYCEGWSLQNVKSQVRDILLPDQVKLDLEFAQFAILAKLWDEPALLEFCKPGLWRDLQAATGIEDKSILKETLYACCYGSTWTTRRNHLQKALNISQDQANRIIRVPIYQKLFNASQRAFQAAKNANSLTDAFGNVLTWKNDKELRSRMAAMAQSYELRLLGPVVEHLVANSVPITVWLHDGLYVPVTASPDTIKKAVSIVGEIASELGISTRLLAQ